MRELILRMAMSVDGFVSDLSGTNLWMFGADQEAKAWGVAFLETAGLHIMGSVTFKAMAAWWPTSTDQFAGPMNRVPKAVFSRQKLPDLMDTGAVPGLDAARANAGATQSAALQPGGESWAETYVASGGLAAEIARLKAEDGKPIIAHGGVRFARSLAAHGLIDKYAFVVAPVALGQGLSPFADLATPMPLKLESSTAFPGGAVAQIYRPA